MRAREGHDGTDAGGGRRKATPLSLDEVRLCIALLEAIVADRALLADVPAAERQALILAAGRASRPARHEATRLVKEFRRRKKRREQDGRPRDARHRRHPRRARRPPVFVAPAPARIAAAPRRRDARRPDPQKPKSCYVCKTDFTRLHFFYDALCPDCAALNYEKRFQTASLDGRVAVITGARVKIGFQTALKMLRAGARGDRHHALPPRRRPALRAREPTSRSGRTACRSTGSTCATRRASRSSRATSSSSLGRLDILINNACQTVRRPPGFYAHLLDFEARARSDLPAGAAAAAALAPRLPVRALGRAAARRTARPRTPPASTCGTAADPASACVASAALSQVPYAYDDATRRVDLFPEGALDADLQQVDLRARNTWRLTLAEVATPEMLEVHLVNAVAPFILCSKLKPLMAARAHRATSTS